MSSYGNFNSTEEMGRFDFTMRATSNDIKTVNSYGDMAFISTDQELPYDNEKKNYRRWRYFWQVFWSR